MYFTDKGCSWHDQWRPCGLERIQDTEKIDQSKSKHYKEPSMSVCLSFCRSLCIDYHSLLSCDFNDDWHSALTENRARWPGEHTGKLSGERRMEQNQKSDTSASNREVKVSQATFFRKENTQKISWKEGKDL